MNKKWLICITAAMALSLVSCNATDQSGTANSDQLSLTENKESSVQTIERSEGENDLSSESTDERPVNSEATETEVGGSYNGTCMEHTFSYHFISGELIDYVGKEEGHAWTNSTADGSNDPYNRIGEDMTILAFIQEFDIPKETFIEVTRSRITDDFLDNIEMTREEYYETFGYTDEQIDALYSGDQDAIDRAFCGPLAFVNEADQKVYSIYWLMDHTAEDYAAAQLSLNQVEEVLQTASEEEYGERYDLIEKVEPKLTQAYALEEAALAETEPSAGIAVPEGAATESIPSEIEESSETAEIGTESSAVVQDETVGSNPAE